MSILCNAPLAGGGTCERKVKHPSLQGQCGMNHGPAQAPLEQRRNIADNITNVIAQYDLEDLDVLCDECGMEMTVGPDGVSNHITEDGEIDYDADGDHVPYTLDEDDESAFRDIHSDNTDANSSEPEVPRHEFTFSGGHPGTTHTRTIGDALAPTIMEIDGKAELVVNGQSFTVYYDEEQAMGDNGQPVRGDFVGDYQVVHNDGSPYGRTILHQHVSPHGSSGYGNAQAKSYAATRVGEAIAERAPIEHD